MVDKDTLAGIVEGLNTQTRRTDRPSRPFAVGDRVRNRSYFSGYGIVKAVMARGFLYVLYDGETEWVSVHPSNVQLVRE